MSLFRSSPEPGDWVRATRFIPATLTDHLLGGDAGIRSGRKGVVTGRHGHRVTVEFDAGIGTCTVTIPGASCRVVRRAAGVDRFRRRAGHLAAARLGVMVAFIGPVLYYVAAYIWANHTTDGLVENLVVGSLASGVGLVAAALQHPVQAVTYLSAGWALSRFAFGR